ncbi:MAG: PASTA domain-containing protein [Thermaceae bacterium]
MVLDGRYQVKEVLGEAGAIRVFRAVPLNPEPPGLLVWYEVHTPSDKEAFYRYRGALKRLEELGLAKPVLSSKPGRYYAFFPEANPSRPRPEVKKRALEAVSPFGFDETHLAFTERGVAYLSPLPLKPPRRPWAWPRVAPGVFLGLVGLLLLWNATLRYLNPPEVEVPDLVGKDVLEVYALLRGTGLNVEVQEGNDPEKPKDIVLEQTPPPGTRLKAGRTLVLVLNQALPTPVPDLAGKPLEVAQGLLEKAGLGLGQVSYTESQAPAGTILASLPSPGSPAKRGLKVDLLVSQGPKAPEGETEVPSLLGLSREEALFLLNAAGLRAEVEEVPSGRPDGEVLGQSPEAGTPLAIGSGVRIQVAVQPGVRLPPPAEEPPQPSERSIELRLNLPSEAEGRRVRLTLLDEQGEHTLFEGEGQAGLPLSGRYTALGEARFRLYLDDVLFQEWSP